MEASKDMLDHYLQYVTVGWFDYDEHDEPASDPRQYYDRVQELRKDAARRGDLGALRLGLDYLLCHPEESLNNHGYVYSWDDEDVREIVRYIRSTIYPNAPPVNCDEVKNVKLVYTSRFEWWDKRRAEGLHSPDLRGN